MINNDKVAKKLIKALEKLYQNDFSLIERRCCERSIVFRLGIYLNEQFRYDGYNVDCEYNKRDEKPKSLVGKKINYPDLIVHKRESKENLIVIEVKTQNDTKIDHLEKDKEKLKGFTKEYQYKYTHGAHIYISKTKCRIAWYYEGKVKKYKKYVISKDTNRKLEEMLEQMNTKKSRFDLFYDEI